MTPTPDTRGEYHTGALKAHASSRDLRRLRGVPDDREQHDNPERATTCV